MIWYDQQFTNKLKEEKIDVLMYRRYVDDINILIKKPDHAMTDSNKDKYIMNMVREIGNNIHPSIQLTTDVPSNYEDNKMPLLDIKVWLEKHNNKYAIRHEFYSKPMTNKSVKYCTQGALSHEDKEDSFNTRTASHIPKVQQRTRMEYHTETCQ